MAGDISACTDSLRVGMGFGGAAQEHKTIFTKRDFMGSEWMHVATNRFTSIACLAFDVSICPFVCACPLECRRRVCLFLRRDSEIAGRVPRRRVFPSPPRILSARDGLSLGHHFCLCALLLSKTCQ